MSESRFPSAPVHSVTSTERLSNARFPSAPQHTPNVSETTTTTTPAMNGNVTSRPPSSRTQTYNGQSETLIMIKDLMARLQKLQHQLPFTPTENPEAKQELQKKIQTLQGEIQTHMQTCDADADCHTQLDTIRDTLAQVLRQGIDPQLPQETPLQQAFAQSVGHEAARQEFKEKSQQLAELQKTHMIQDSQAQMIEKQLRRQLEQSTQQLSNLEAKLRGAEGALQSLQRTHELCQNKSNTLLAAQAAYENGIQTKLQEQKAIIDELKGRERAALETTETLKRQQQALQKATEELKQMYDAKVRELESAPPVPAEQPAFVGSERELQLRQQIQRLQNDLAQSVKALRVSRETSQKAMLDLTNAQRPHGQLAAELYKVNEELTARNREVDILRQELSEARKSYAQIGQDMADDTEKARQEAVAEANRLSDRIRHMQEELDHAQRRQRVKEKEASKVHEKIRFLKQEQQNELKNEEAKREKLQLKIRELQITINELKRNIDTRDRVQQRKLINQENRLKAELRHEYSEKMKKIREQNIELQKQLHNAQLNVEQAQLARENYIRDAHDTKQEFEERKAQLEKQFESLKDQNSILKRDIADARSRINQTIADRKEQERITELIQADLNVQRDQSTKAKEEMQGQINQLKETLETHRAKLHKSTQARDSALQKLHTVQSENHRLRQEVFRFNEKLRRYTEQKEAEITAIQAKSRAQADSVASCARNLRNTSVAHDHMVRMRDQALTMLKNAEAKQKQANEALAVSARCERDRDISKTQKQELRQALREANLKVKELQQEISSLKNTRQHSEVVAQKLKSKMVDLASKYEEALDQQDVENQRKLNANMQERAELITDADELRRQLQKTKERAKALLSQRNMANQLYLDAELSTVKQAKLINKMSKTS